MKKISTKIILSIVCFCLATSIIITGVTNIMSKNAMRKEAENNLLQLSKNNAQTVNEGLISTKDTVDNISNLISSTIELNQVSGDDNYITNYTKFLTPIMQKNNT